MIQNNGTYNPNACYTQDPPIVTTGISYLGALDQIPLNPTLGNVYHDSNGQCKFYDGSIWVDMINSPTTDIGGNRYATLSDIGMFKPSYLDEKHDPGYESHFMRDAIKAAKRGLITQDQAFRLMEMIIGDDVESKELAQSILDEKKSDT
jgi:hypothetical protein